MTNGRKKAEMGNNPTGERILLQLRNLLRNQSFCDVQFSFIDGGKSVGGHVSILSARNRVFAAMFQSNGMRESTTGRVDIKDRIFLNDCSTTFTPSKSRRYCPKRSLFVAADMYGIADLKEKCIQLLVPFIGWTIRSRY